MLVQHFNKTYGPESKRGLPEESQNRLNDSLVSIMVLAEKCEEKVAGVLEPKSPKTVQQYKNTILPGELFIKTVE